MKRLSLFLSIILLLGAVSANAQRRGKKNAKAKKAETEEVVVDPRIQIMIAATQKILFIDSIVVDKKNFLAHYNISPEIGTICKTRDFYNSKDTTNTYIHVNGFGNRGILSAYKDTLTYLYETNRYGDEWSTPEELKGLSDTTLYKNLNHPFLMSDGSTFYFAAQGNESIGGYDIFVTRYDSEDNSFLKAENIGMPFNSEANDYMYVIDEYNNIGWFVTDRNQPANKVCIYSFIPNETRTTYGSDVSQEKLKQLARISKISDTWTDNQMRVDALERISNNYNRIRQASESVNKFSFIINDNITYTTDKDFKNKENILKFKELQTLKDKLVTIGKTLEITRNFYASASAEEKSNIHNGIVTNENEYYEIEKRIKELEKEIRNSEIKVSKQ